MISWDKSISEYKSLESSLTARRDLAVGLLREHKKNAAEATETLKNLLSAQSISQQAAQVVQQKAHKQICDIVNRCLSAVFEDPYEFKILFEQKRGKTEATLLFERDGMQINPMEDSGGGVIDIASFALRLSCILLSKPKIRKIMILDEPFKWVDKKYLEKVKTMLETLSKDLGVQIIMVTHIDEIVTGKEILI